MGRQFPYAERAAAARLATAAIGPAHARVRRRNDAEDPATQEWIRSIADAYAAIDAAYAPDFHDAMTALRRGEFGAIDPLIAFLEADPIFFRSGYVKEVILDRFKRVPFDAKQAARLRDVLWHVVRTRDCREFRRYCRLAPYVEEETFRDDLTKMSSTPDEGTRRRARWMLQALERTDRKSVCGKRVRPRPS